VRDDRGFVSEGEGEGEREVVASLGWLWLELERGALCAGEESFK
jgi:hypothetical protein